jgi:GTP-binding protein
LPKPLPEVAFVGKSNVGKSSLLNLLVNNYSIAYTSKTPGKTQQLNYFIVNRSQEDKKFFLVDLPGYGYARVSKEMRDKWVDLIRDYLEHRKCLKVLFHLIDASQGLSQEDRYFIEFLLTSNVLDRYHAVLTKMDKCTKSKDVIVKSIQSELVALGFPFEVVIIPTSVKQRWGSEDLWLALKPLLLDKKSSSRPSA